jgi:hypothetical protein
MKSYKDMNILIIIIMSGFYNNWYKVTHPNSSNDIVQMKSGGSQTPFYFGGSQVPETLGINTHKISGKRDKRKISFQPDTNKPVYIHGEGIHIPKMIGSLKKSI